MYEILLNDYKKLIKSIKENNVEKFFITQQMWNELPQLEAYGHDLGPLKIIQTNTYILKVLKPVAMTTDNKILVVVVDAVSYMGD